MKPRHLFAALLLAAGWIPAAPAEEFSYEAIAERHASARLGAKEVEDAKMQGECLVGLKQLIFVRRDDFDPVAEWINYRTFSLLEQFPPCHVLVMMEVARKELLGDGA